MSQTVLWHLQQKSGGLRRHIPNVQLKQVASTVHEKLGQKLELVGMDACIMSMPEVSYPGAGTPGTFVITIHPPPDTITTPATLKVGSAGTVESYIADWKQVTGQ
jgi:hypothetical protein